MGTVIKDSTFIGAAMTKSKGFDGRPAGTHAESGSYFCFLEQLGSCWNTPPHPNFTGPLTGNGPFWVAHAMKNLLALWGTCVQSLGQEGPLGEGRGNPLHYSCLENSMARGAWQATVNGIAESDMTE